MLAPDPNDCLHHHILISPPGKPDGPLHHRNEGATLEADHPAIGVPFACWSTPQHVWSSRFHMPAMQKTQEQFNAPILEPLREAIEAAPSGAVAPLVTE